MKESQLRMLQNVPIFGGVREDILELLLEGAAEISLAKGDYLFVENDSGDTMYVLEEGEVGVLKLWNKVYYQLNCLSAGDCVGEMSLIDLGRRSASVLALTDCRAIELTNAQLLKVYEKDIEQFALIQMNIGRELSRRLRIANDTVFRALIKSKQIPVH
jgi:CRP/FNR family cyclic AMP-dependent transcriptional regulator